MKKILPAVLVLALMAAVLFALLRNTQQNAPAFHLNTLDGTSVSEQNFNGKITLLNFWYPSCPGCVTEMPKLIDLQQKYSGGTYQTIAISLNYNSEAEVRAYTTQYHLPFTVAYDPDNNVAESYKVQLTPMSFLIDANRKIVRSYVGEPNWVELENEIKQQLQGQKQ